MKNSSLPILSFLTVLAATLLLPVSAGVASIALTLTGVIAMLAADYGREMPPLRVQACVVPFEFSGNKQAGLKSAA
jgi:hypothetical protein